MSFPANDPDDLVQQKVDLNHVTKMSYQMHVPDSITVGPNRPNMPRLHMDDDRLPVRMEVPNSIRLAGHSSAEIYRSQDSLNNNDVVALSSDALAQQTANGEHFVDNGYTAIDKLENNQQYQPIKMADSWHIEPFADFDEKQVINKIHLLQNRIHTLERTLARRDFRDRFVYSVLIGYVILQALFSVRRSILN